MKLNAWAGFAMAILCHFDAQLDAVETVDPPKVVGRIERLDPALDQLIDPEAPIERLATGFQWSEGPVWIPQGEYVLFSDVPENTIYRWKEGEGVRAFIQPSGYTSPVPRSGESGSNGLALDQQGRLLLCQHGDRRVARLESPLGADPPRYSTVVGKYEGQEFNSPNDLVIHTQSQAIYFTDPPYGREGGFQDPDRPLKFQGVYRLSRDGELKLLTDKLRAPNGIGLSPDEKTLYVAQSWGEAPIVMAYNVQPDGSIDDGRVFFDAKHLAQDRPGSPDGLKVDQHGNLFATGPGGVLVLSPDGKHLGTIISGDRIANCGFGNDGRTLYMTCDDHFCRVRLKTRGLGF